MDRQQRKILLSEVLDSSEKFNIDYQEWMDRLRGDAGEDGETEHRVKDISTRLGVLTDYLRHLQETFVQLKTYNIHQDDWKWFYQGRESVISACGEMKQIDEYLNQTVSILELHDSTNTQLTLAQVERVSDLLLDVKSHVYGYRRKMEIATSFKEINESIITSLKLEMESCIHRLVALRNTTSIPPAEKITFTMEEIAEKMKINDMSLTHSMSVKSLRLPTFNETDNAIYEEYLAIESRIRPLEFSIDVLPTKVEEFSYSCSAFFPKAIEQLNRNLESLKGKWELVQNALYKVKREVIDTRWNEIFVFLVTNLNKKCHRLITRLEIEGHITDSIGMSYKFCSNCITMINKAFNEGLIYEAEVHDLFYNRLLPEWETLSYMISSSPSSSNNGTPQKSRQTDGNGFRVFHTAKKPSDRPRSIAGIDLGISVENAHAPFSITKKDRVKDFLASDVELKKSNVRRALSSLNEDNDYDNDDEMTLVNKTPNLKAHIDNIDINGLKISHKPNPEALLHELARKPCTAPSKIPILREDYVTIGAPKVAMKKYEHTKRSSIPRYIRRPEQAPPTRSEGSLLDPPAFLMPTSTPYLQHETNKAEVFRKPSGPLVPARSRTSSVSSSRRVSSLSDSGIPNLSVRKSSYNSTSPDRPTSSIGNRYDAEHLIQPLDAAKPSWK